MNAMPHLLVAPPPPQASPSQGWQFVVSPDGYRHGEHGEAPDAASLKSRAEGHELSLVLPAGACAWHRVQVPVKAPAARRLLQAGSSLQTLLQNALEDDLLEEPARLHLAVQKLDGADGTCWILVCPRAWLQQALAQLQDVGLHAGRLLPEFGPLPDLKDPGAGVGSSPTRDQDATLAAPAPTQIHVTGSPEDAWLTCCTPAGVWRLRAGTAALGILPVSLDAEPGAELLAEPRVASLAQELTGQVPILRTAAERWLQRLQAGENLAQFEFAYLSGLRWKKTLELALQRLIHAPQWRLPRVLVASLLVVNLLGLEAYAWVENQRVRDLKAVLAAQFRDAFPTVPLVLSPREQMAREVSLLRRASGAPDPQGLDTLLAKAAAASDPARADRIDYEGRVLHVHVPALAAEAVRARAAAERARGYVLTTDDRGLSVSRAEAPR